MKKNAFSLSFFTLLLALSTILVTPQNSDAANREFSKPRFKLKNNTHKQGGTNEPLKFRLVARYDKCSPTRKNNELPRINQQFPANQEGGRYDDCQYLVYEAVIEPGGEAYYDFHKATGYVVNLVEVYKKNDKGQWPAPGSEPLRQASGTWQRVELKSVMGIPRGFWHGVAQIEPQKGDQYKLTVGYR